jgi:hypothetical protein
MFIQGGTPMSVSVLSSAERHNLNLIADVLAYADVPPEQIEKAIDGLLRDKFSQMAHDAERSHGHLLRRTLFDHLPGDPACN